MATTVALTVPPISTATLASSVMKPPVAASVTGASGMYMGILIFAVVAFFSCISLVIGGLYYKEEVDTTTTTKKPTTTYRPPPTTAWTWAPGGDDFAIPAICTLKTPAGWSQNSVSTGQYVTKKCPFGGEYTATCNQDGTWAETNNCAPAPTPSTSPPPPTWRTNVNYDNAVYNQHSKIQSRYGNYCIDTLGGSDGSQIAMNTCAGGNSDGQYINTQGYGQIQIGTSGKCIDALKDVINAGDPVGIHGCGDQNSPHQLFQWSNGNGKIKYQDLNGKIWCVNNQGAVSGAHTYLIFQKCNSNSQSNADGWYEQSS